MVMECICNPQSQCLRFNPQLVLEPETPPVPVVPVNDPIIKKVGPAYLTNKLNLNFFVIVARCISEKTTTSRNLLLTGERIQLLLPVRRIDMNEKESDGRENLPPRIQQTVTLILKTKLKVLKRFDL